jgi:hypothetical protein
VLTKEKTYVIITSSKEKRKNKMTKKQMKEIAKKQRCLEPMNLGTRTMNTPKYKKRAKQSAEDRKNFKKFY